MKPSKNRVFLQLAKNWSGQIFFIVMISPSRALQTMETYDFIVEEAAGDKALAAGKDHWVPLGKNREFLWSEQVCFHTHHMQLIIYQIKWYENSILMVPEGVNKTYKLIWYSRKGESFTVGFTYKVS